jgi:hypothetical protein
MRDAGVADWPSEVKEGSPAELPRQFLRLRSFFRNRFALLCLTTEKILCEGGKRSITNHSYHDVTLLQSGTGTVTYRLWKRHGWDTTRERICNS